MEGPVNVEFFKQVTVLRDIMVGKQELHILLMAVGYHHASFVLRNEHFRHISMNESDSNGRIESVDKASRAYAMYYMNSNRLPECRPHFISF